MDDSNLFVSIDLTSSKLNQIEVCFSSTRPKQINTLRLQSFSCLLISKSMSCLSICSVVNGL